MTLANRFGWSISREAMFQSCQRRYYFHYYLSWGGWEEKAPAIAKEAFLLKRLVGLSLWRGQLVHYVVTKILSSLKVKGKIPDREKVISYLNERFDKQYEFSRNRLYLKIPKKSGERINADWLALIDHEYGREISLASLERTRSECLEAITNLLASPILVRVLQTDRNLWKIENLDAAEFSQQFDFSGATVYVKMDFMFRDRNSNLVIVDWKTGKSSESEFDSCAEEHQDPSSQLSVYAYYASKVLGVPAESIRLYEVALLRDGKISEYVSNRDILLLAEERISKGIANLSQVLVDQDTERNEPMPIEAFPAIDDGRCRFCNFYRICKDDRNTLLSY